MTITLNDHTKEALENVAQWLQEFAEEAEIVGQEEIFKVLEQAAEAARDAVHLLDEEKREWPKQPQ